MTDLADRLAALDQFVQASTPYLGEQELAPARELVERAGERLALSRGHTVVALAGSTGTGKSSIFNKIAGKDLSPTGVRRPTTGQAHACVWGAEEAKPLLDWLKVGRRHQRDGDAALDGLVLLDLPDFDSVNAEHRIEADRLLAVVDLIVWVLNPQKYADRVVHRGYIEQFQRYGDITVVVLNQADLLSRADLEECLTDLRRLLAGDGLSKVPIVTASTVTEPGLEGLRRVLTEVVVARRAAMRRLAADVDSVVSPFAFPKIKGKFLSGTVDTLTDSLGNAAGVPTVARATEQAYVHRARKVTGWPPLKWLRRLRPDPLARLHLEAPGATSIDPAAPAARAAASLAVRATAASVSLPGSWQEAVLDAARSKMDDLPDALDRAVSQTDLGLGRTRLWWRAVGVLQWLFVAAAAAGLLWLVVRYALFALALPEPPMPAVGRLPLPTALLAAGLLAGLVLSFLVRPVVRLAARRQRRRVEKRLRANVSQVARDYVIAPAAGVLEAYDTAAKALAMAEKR
jgi:GTP-binding protein EngB required for normal cell division